MMKYGLYSFWRNRRISGITVGLVLASVLFLLTFCSNIAVYQRELAQSYRALRVSAYITAAEGKSPRLQSDTYQKILDSGYISQYQVMAEHTLPSGTVLRALSDVNMDPTLRDCQETIKWATGYDASVFSGSKLVCLLPARLSWEPEGTQEIRIGGQAYSFTVVGVYGSKFSSSGGTVYYCPINTLQEIYRTEDLAFSYNGMEMELQKLNQLDLFKSQMKQLGLQNGEARLVIRDMQLQTVTGQLRRQVRMLEALLPLLFAMIAGISFALSFLLLRGRRREVAVLRSLGMPRVRVFAVFLLETALQALLGLLLGVVTGSLLFGSSALQPTYLMTAFFCYLFGGGVAVWRLSGINVFTAMTVRE